MIGGRRHASLAEGTCVRLERDDELRETGADAGVGVGAHQCFTACEFGLDGTEQRRKSYPFGAPLFGLVPSPADRVRHLLVRRDA